MDKKGSLFSIGRTARLFRLSVSSLRHYEAIGLVRPAWTDPASGYRYYSLAQFEVLNTIRYLRTLDMPLEQIRSFLENRDPAWGKWGWESPRTICWRGNSPSMTAFSCSWTQRTGMQGRSWNCRPSPASGCCSWAATRRLRNSTGSCWLS